MKNYFWLDCSTVLDTIYMYDKDSSLSRFTQLRTELHLLLCPSCTEELRQLKNVEEIIKSDFLRPSPDFEGIIMQQIMEETNLGAETDAPAGFSFRGWVIIGFFVLLSLTSSFFGINFIEIANAEGSSFLLPLGLTIGMVVTCYGAFFIGSHLKELSSWFKLR